MGASAAAPDIFEKKTQEVGCKSAVGTPEGTGHQTVGEEKAPFRRVVGSCSVPLEFFDN